jgi:hypothetical protein
VQRNTKYTVKTTRKYKLTIELEGDGVIQNMLEADMRQKVFEDVRVGLTVREVIDCMNESLTATNKGKQANCTLPFPLFLF